jgi:cell division transport system permease protein
VTARLSYIIRRALQAMRQGPFGAATIALTIALALTAVGGLWASGNLVVRGLDQWGRGLVFSVLLRDGCNPAERSALQSRLRVVAPGAPPTFVSKADALASMRASFGELGAVLDDLPENPLRDSFELPAMQVPLGRLDELGRLLKGQPCVEDVDFGAEWLGPAQRLLGGLRWALGALFVLIASVTLILVSNTFQLAIYARREEIGILKLVGATDGFVRWPFLLEGLFEGLVGGGLAGGAVAGGLGALWPRALAVAPVLATLGDHPLPLVRLALMLVGAGAGIGFLASGFAVGRFLRV